MKRILSLTAILASALVFTSAISINQSPLNVPQDEKGKKHIKMVKIGDDGKKMEIDTVMKVDEVLIWNGDTIDGGHAMKWVSKGDFDMDMDFDMDFDVEEDGSGNVFIMKSGNKTAPAVYEFKTEDGDSSKQYRIKVIGGDEADVLKWHSKGDNDMFFGAPAMAPAHKIIRIDKQDGNVIDLSDPGIISFEKKELKDGREKITIVREKPAKESKEIHEEIIMKSAGNSPVFIQEGMPHKSKQIKVIAGDDGKVEIFEDGKVWNVHEGDDDVQVIEKDGKKITIKKIKKDGEMKVDVEVEEEVEEQK
ncbi:hypothetical protein [uncultured Draconibacterium sp.]|uniref:hypothetical protein n=1 Tax=uncultured Draconibacterium sp. TaxID=1573823 RepID=UPI0032176F80